MWLIWLQNWWDVCTTYQPSEFRRWVAGLSNLAIAIAYFWIPLNMWLIKRKHKEDILFPLIWYLYIAFITWCGITHTTHIWHAVFDPDRTYMLLELFVNAITGTLSVGTAIIFTWHLPRIMKYVSPAARQALLEKEIQERTIELSSALAIKETLLREVHHRVKNNLQIILSLVNLHKRKFTATSEVFSDLANRIFAMSNIHDQMKEINANSSFDVEDFLIRQCNELKTVYNKPDIKCSVNEIDYSINFDNASPLAMIINEVLSNAFKHGFRNRQTGTITCTLERLGSHVLLTIEDNGVGIENAPKHPDSNGIGMLLVNSLKVKLNATIYFDESPDGGTTVRIIIPETTEESRG
jgi:two-component sensor histidine kinase